MTLNIGKLGGNLYINFTVAAVMEFLGNLLCLLMDKTGRKAMHLSLMFLTGAACLSSAIPVLFGNECKNCILFRVFMCRKKNLKFISMKWHLLSIVLFFQ